jgi:membrane protein required for colicin V production
MLLAILVASLVLGAWRGLVYEVLSLANWFAAFLLAQWFAPLVAGWLPMAGATAQVRHAAGFVLAFIGSLLVGGVLTLLLAKLIAAVGLRPVDRLLGALFGALRGVVLLLALALAVHLTPLHTSFWWQDSAGAKILTAALHGLKPAMPQAFEQYLP